MKKIVVSGFEPFDGYGLNPSEELVNLLHDTIIDDFSIKGIVLPLDYRTADKLLLEFVKRNDPEYIICMGQSNRPSISLELVALNLVSTERKDNKGYAPAHHRIINDAPLAYASKLDLFAIAKLIRKKGIPAEVSFHAGSYGCNWIYYHVLLWCETSNDVNANAVFVHIPPMPEQAIEKRDSGLPTMPLGYTVDAIRTLIGYL